MLLPPSCTRRSFFFFSSYRAHRDLHSFPTRRSSDLIADRAARESFGKLWGAPLPEKPGLDARQMLDAARSEEHTSELQSRGHLVCRLLLEKKNRNLPYKDR